MVTCHPRVMEEQGNSEIMIRSGFPGCKSACCPNTTYDHVVPFHETHLKEAKLFVWLRNKSAKEVEWGSIQSLGRMLSWGAGESCSSRIKHRGNLTSNTGYCITICDTWCYMDIAINISWHTTTSDRGNHKSSNGCQQQTRKKMRTFIICRSIYKDCH